ncbi:YhcN/YlaJ family sporulation lipoprotein [Halalkalibacter akibai]|uniref:Lipoprotein n=1 Tax=Halalkalibacter akibai (strain ATCC 43226 / DSM 21942 / CIP 109018 / JCM 9157 / 1139) TaxID=1236973 RepID=W4QW34_HALA3|nr:YhcN/YlaJ family sporulation lipoprotein [Halalkalibacter akibai]GAE35848.1 lipoprotein [Halalkalibacter akibai JCM 9157]
MKGLIKGFIVLAVLTGCQMLEPQQDIRPLELSTNAVIDQESADEAKKIVLSMEEVTEIKGVSYENEIYLAPRVKHFDRFRLKEIRKTGHQSVKKRYPDATVHVSTDQKIFMELEKLEKELKEKTISEQRLKQKLKHLDEMMRG